MQESQNLPLLEVQGISTVIPSDDGPVRVVQDVSFAVHKGQTLGVVGESGCGKSITGLSILQLVPSNGVIDRGQILFRKAESDGSLDIARMAPKGEEMRSIRGNDIAMIFQEPMTSLNPVYTIGEQIGEAVRLHRRVNREESRKISMDMLDRVGIPGARQRIDEYPHQLSGGMRQRAMIAMALCCNPKLLIADEPTTALDVTIQAQILDLLRALQQEMGMAIIMITHDLGVIADMADEVVVMYAGRVVESGHPDAIFYTPQHPYTRGLLTSIPKLGEKSSKPLAAIPGYVPSPRALPPGCSFAPRCNERMDKCNQLMPEFEEKEQGHKARCWLGSD